MLPALVVGGVVLLAAPPVPGDGAVFSLASLHLQDFRSAASDDGVWSIAVKDDDPDSPTDSAHEHETAHAPFVESPIQRASDHHALRAPPR
ncbi:MAG: hypothetical protein DMG00_24125 [Acidobacteria bacterium]|nr:MAG: hypothetical protein DMG00_24125 [Acidobacteriota bacterium]